MTIEDLRGYVNPVKYSMHLLKSTGETIAIIPNQYVLDFDLEQNIVENVFELNFTMPKKVMDYRYTMNMIDNPIYSLIKSDYIIRLYKEYDTSYIAQDDYLITDIEEDSGDGTTISIGCYSKEFELSYKIFPKLDDDTAVYEISDLLDIITSLSPSWSVPVNGIGAGLNGLYMSFTTSSGQNCIEVINDIKERYVCLFTFDTINKEIYVKLADNLESEFLGLYLDERNFIQSINKTTTINNTATRLYGYGADDESIASVNPTGQSFIDDLSYYRNTDYMSQGLIDALDDYDSYVTSQEGVYKTLLDELSILNDELLDLEAELVTEQQLLTQYQDNLELTDQSSDGLIDGEDKEYWQSMVDTQQEVVDNKQLEVDSKQLEIDNKNTEITTFQQNILLANNLTDEQVKELDKFIRETKYENDDYYDMQELYDKVKSDLVQNSSPYQSFDIDIIDFLSNVEYSDTWKRLELGCIVMVNSDNVNISNQKVRNTAISINYSGQDIPDVQLSFSNDNRLDNPAYSTTDFESLSVNSYTQILENNGVWSSYDQDKDNLYYEIYQGTIDLATREILNSTNNSVVMDSTGMYFLNATSPDYIQIVNNYIGLFKDNVLKTAISPEGVIADVIIGTLLVGNQLQIIGQQGSMIFEENAIKIIDENGNLKGLFGLNDVTGEIGVNIIGGDTIFSDGTGTFNITDNQLIIKDLDENIRVQAGLIDENNNIYGLIVNGGTKVSNDVYTFHMDNDGIEINDTSGNPKVILGDFTNRDGDDTYGLLVEGGEIYGSYFRAGDDDSYLEITEQGNLFNYNSGDLNISILPTGFHITPYGATINSSGIPQYNTAPVDLDIGIQGYNNNTYMAIKCDVNETNKIDGLRLECQDGSNQHIELVTDEQIDLITENVSGYINLNSGERGDIVLTCTLLYFPSAMRINTGDIVTWEGDHIIDTDSLYIETNQINFNRETTLNMDNGNQLLKIDGHLHVMGDITATGTIESLSSRRGVVATKNIIVNDMESTKELYSDFNIENKIEYDGIGEIINGEYIIEIDNEFLQMANPNTVEEPFIVQLTPYDWLTLKVDSIIDNQIIIKEKDNANGKFAYTIKAYAKGDDIIED